MELGRYILYNTNEEKITWEGLEPYKIDGQTPNLPSHILHLRKAHAAAPQYNQETEKLVENIYIDHDNDYYVYDWTIVQKTQYEMDMDDWGFQDKVKRIVAPMAMITDPNDHTGVKFLAWFQAQQLPVEKHNDNVRLYCNVILAEHQTIVDAYSGVITIEDIPDPNNY